jgi:hypothetical protein
MQSRRNTGIQASNLVGNNVRGRFPESGRWFNDRFFDNHRSYDFFRQPGANWWGAASWGAVASWLPWGWQDPYYYYPEYTASDYGYPPASDLYLQLTAEEAASSAGPSQNAAQEVVTSTEGAWMPLGVFAAGVSAKDAAYSNFFIQLAVDKNGDIAGTFYNAALDESQPITGSIDQTTQQVVWKISDKPSSPVMMTGLYNLTQDTTEMQVAFADDVQSWVLVRVNQ